MCLEWKHILAYGGSKMDEVAGGRCNAGSEALGRPLIEVEGVDFETGRDTTC